VEGENESKYGNFLPKTWTQSLASKPDGHILVLQCSVSVSMSLTCK